MISAPALRGAALAIAAAVLGCTSSSGDHFGPPPPVPACMGSCPGVGIHVHGPDTGSGGGDAGAEAEKPIDITGAVGVAVSAELDQIEPYTGATTVYGPGVSGKLVGAPYGGDAGATFTLSGVLAGSDWLYAQDDTGGGTGVFSTFSPHTLPSKANLVVPVLDQSVLTAVASSQPGAPLLDATRAHIVLAVRRANMPLAGVSIAGSAGAGLVTYDQGPGLYSSQATATGSAGGIVILNAQATASGSGISIQLVDAAAKTFAVEVPVAPGVATIAELSL